MLELVFESGCGVSSIGDMALNKLLQLMSLEQGYLTLEFKRNS